MHVQSTGLDRDHTTVIIDAVIQRAHRDNIFSRETCVRNRAPLYAVKTRQAASRVFTSACMNACTSSLQQAVFPTACGVAYRGGKAESDWEKSSDRAGAWGGNTARLCARDVEEEDGFAFTV